MRSLFRKKSLPGWLGIRQSAGRFELAHVVRQPTERPRLDFYVRQDAENADSGGASAGFVDFLKADKAYKNFQCNALMPAEHYQWLQVEAPGVPEAEQKEALRWTLKDLIEQPVEAVTYDIIPVPANVAPGRSPQLFVAVASRDAVSQVVADFHSAGLQLEAIDVIELAQRNVAALFEEENRALAFLAFSETSALLTFTYQGELFSIRRIDLGARQFLDANEDRRMQLAERIALELQRSIDGVDRQFSSVSLSKMIVALPPDCGIEAFLADNLYVPFEAMDLNQVMDLSAVPELASPEAQRQALGVIGVALRDEGGMA